MPKIGGVGKSWVRRMVRGAPYSSVQPRFVHRGMLPRQAPPAMAMALRRGRGMSSRLVGGLIEKKYVDQVIASSNINNTWAGGEKDPAGGVNCLGACTQGTGESNRDGVRIIVKSIEICGQVNRPKAADQADMRAGDVVQVALVMDTQSNGVQLNAEDVYTDSTPCVPGKRVVANSMRFKVLKSQLFFMSDTSAGTDGANTNSLGGMSKGFHWFVKLNQVVNFVTGVGAGTIADFKDVSFHVIACCSTVDAPDYLIYHSRVRFIG